MKSRTFEFHRIQSGEAYPLGKNDMHKNMVQHRKGDIETQQEIDEIRRYQWRYGDPRDNVLGVIDT
jgi:hypothetical protein